MQEMERALSNISEIQEEDGPVFNHLIDLSALRADTPIKSFDKSSLLNYQEDNNSLDPIQDFA